MSRQLLWASTLFLAFIAVGCSRSVPTNLTLERTANQSFNCQVEPIVGTATLKRDSSGSSISSEVDLIITANRPATFHKSKNSSNVFTKAIYKSDKKNSIGFRGAYDSVGTHLIEFTAVDSNSKESTSCSAQVVVNPESSQSLPDCSIQKVVDTVTLKTDPSGAPIGRSSVADIIVLSNKTVNFQIQNSSAEFESTLYSTQQPFSQGIRGTLNSVGDHVIRLTVTDPSSNLSNTCSTTIRVNEDRISAPSCSVQLKVSSSRIKMDQAGNPMERSTELDMVVIANRAVSFAMLNDPSHFSSATYSVNSPSALGYRGTINAPGTHDIRFKVTDAATQLSGTCSAQVNATAYGIATKRIYRYHNINNAFFYALTDNAALPGYVLDGTSFLIFSEPSPVCSTRLFQHYTMPHWGFFLTIDPNDVHRFNDTMGYVCTTQYAGTVPTFRLGRGGISYLSTVSAEERDLAIQHGWVWEGAPNAHFFAVSQ